MRQHPISSNSLRDVVFTNPSFNSFKDLTEMGTLSIFTVLREVFDYIACPMIPMNYLNLGVSGKVLICRACGSLFLFLEGDFSLFGSGVMTVSL